MGRAGISRLSTDLVVVLNQAVYAKLADLSAARATVAKREAMEDMKKLVLKRGRFDEFATEKGVCPQSPLTNDLKTGRAAKVEKITEVKKRSRTRRTAVRSSGPREDL
jgi:hypothetical protein